MAKDKISISAWTVILSHVLLSRDARWKTLVVVEDIAFYRSCLNYCDKRFGVCRTLGKLPDFCLLWLIQRLVAYGAPQHFVLRKRAIRAQAMQSVEQGAEQIVVIGAGFDILAFATAQAFSQVRCFELDVPSMCEHKVQVLKDCYGKLPGNFFAAGVDLSLVPMRDALAALPGFSREKATLFIAEGVVMYLTEESVSAMFSDVHAAADSSEVLFTAIAKPPKPKENIWSRIRSLFLGYNKEAFSWCMEAVQMAGFLRERGFGEQYHNGYVELQKDLRTQKELDQLERQNGEYLVYAASV